MITKRLKTVADLVCNANIVFDVGTDHGYVPIYLIEGKKAKRVIASDITKGPCENARNNILKNGLSDKIEIRQGDGLETLKEDELDTVIIAGMGGILIKDIIKRSFSKVKKLNRIIMQPMNSKEVLRKFLSENNFKIEKEVAVTEEKRIYNIIVAKYGEKDIYEKEAFYHIGMPSKFNLEDNETKIYIEHKKKEAEKVLKAIKTAETNTDDKKKLYEEILRETEVILDEIKRN